MSDSMLEALDKAFESLDSDATIRELKERLKEAEKVIKEAEDDLYHICLFNPSIKSKSWKLLDEYQQKYTSEDRDENS